MVNSSIVNCVITLFTVTRSVFLADLKVAAIKSFCVTHSSDKKGPIESEQNRLFPRIRPLISFSARVTLLPGLTPVDSRLLHDMFESVFLLKKQIYFFLS